MTTTPTLANLRREVPKFLARVGKDDRVIVFYAGHGFLRGGKTYLGFEGPPGDDQDREILSMSENMFVVRYINPETNDRYGTLIYVRCKAA